MASHCDHWPAAGGARQVRSSRGGSTGVKPPVAAADVQAAGKAPLRRRRDDVPGERQGWGALVAPGGVLRVPGCGNFPGLHPRRLGDAPPAALRACGTRCQLDGCGAVQFIFGLTPA